MAIQRILVVGPDSELPGPGQMGGIQEAPELGLLARPHDGERAQDPVGGPGQPIGRVDSLREESLDFSAGLLTGGLHGRSLPLRDPIREEPSCNEKHRDRDGESPNTRPPHAEPTMLSGSRR